MEPRGKGSKPACEGRAALVSGCCGLGREQGDPRGQGPGTMSAHVPSSLSLGSAPQMQEMHKPTVADMERLRGTFLYLTTLHLCRESIMVWRKWKQGHGSPMWTEPAHQDWSAESSRLQRVWFSPKKTLPGSCQAPEATCPSSASGINISTASWL